MHTVTITSKGQLSLPASVRRGLGVRAGDRLTFLADASGGYRVVPLRKTEAADELVGFLKAHAGAKPLSLDEIKDAVADAASESGMAGRRKRT